MYMYSTYCTNNVTVQHHTSLQILVINNKVSCQGNWPTTKLLLTINQPYHRHGNDSVTGYYSIKGRDNEIC